MRIINGSHKRKRIVVPKNMLVRPTTDFAKESIFNIINNHFDFDAIEVLDLFAGTGNISYEFASRGAIGVRSVDNNYSCVKLINNISKELSFTQLKAIKQDAFHFLKRCTTNYDIIFADPPYQMTDSTLIPEIVFQNQLLKEEGWLIVEHSEYVDFSLQEHFMMSKSYGNVNFSIFTH